MSTLFRARGIHTFDGDEPVEALLVADGRVLAAGAAQDLRPRADRIVEFDGWLTPGFNDAHIHPTMTAQNSLHVDLSPEAVGSDDDVAAALRARAATLPPGAWVVGARYDESKSTGGRVLTRDDLDRLVPDHPTLVIHVAVHWGVANSAALALAGLDDATGDPPGGQLGRDGAGRLDGLLYEQALFDVAYPSLSRGEPVITPHPLETRLDALDTVQQQFHAAGLTSVCDALCGPAEIDLLMAARSQGRLTLRTGFLVAHPHYGLVAENGWHPGWGDEMLRFVGVKAFVDGACAGGNCLLDQPFEGTDDHGMQVLGDDDLDALIHRVAADGVPICVHANGDRAIRLVLEGHEAARRRGVPPARHRIEHCSLVDEDILARMRTLGLVAVPFGSYARFHGDKLEGYYGTERLERMFAHRSFLESGVAVAGSSDYPCGPYQPLDAIASCVQRTALDGRPVGLGQRIPIREAWRIYTAGSAFATGEEAVKGTLAPGMLADLVAFDVDPLSAPADEIAGLAVTSTWVGGEQVWAAAGH